MASTWGRKLFVVGAMALGAAFAAGCERNKPGTDMGHIQVDDNVRASPDVHGADHQRFGPTYGFRVAPAPTIRNGDPYQIPAGSRIPPPVTSAGVGGSGTAGTAQQPSGRSGGHHR